MKPTEKLRRAIAEKLGIPHDVNPYTDWRWVVLDVVQRAVNDGYMEHEKLKEEFKGYLCTKCSTCHDRKECPTPGWGIR